LTERSGCPTLPPLFIGSRRWSMFRGVLLGLVFLALVLIGSVQADAQSAAAPRVWTQLDGIVEQLEATRLTLKTDPGARVRVDISAMSSIERKELARGRRVSLIGYTSSRTGEFMAWFAPAEREEATAQASPPTTPPSATPPPVATPQATPAPIPLPAR
jgi:hypothetical protein